MARVQYWTVTILCIRFHGGSYKIARGYVVVCKITWTVPNRTPNYIEIECTWNSYPDLSVSCRVYSYYPLYPPHPDVPVDVEHFDIHCRLPVTPHLMILPSDLRCFIKVIWLILWLIAIVVVHCPQKSEPPKHFATATTNLHRFGCNFTHTRRHLFLSSTPSFIRIPYSVYEIFNSFKLLSQISVTNTASHSFSLWLLHLPVPAGQYQSPLCPWDGCTTVSWDARLHQPTGLATEKSRSQSGGLCDLGHSAGTSTAARSVTSTIWKNDWLKSGAVLIKTLLTDQWISGMIDCINVYARKGDTSNIWFEHFDCSDWHQLCWKIMTCG